jgi:integrase
MKHSNKIEPTTYDAYQRNIEKVIVPYFKPLRLKLRDLTPMHFEQFVNHCSKTVYRGKPLSGQTVIRYMANVLTCLNGAVAKRLIPYNPANLVENMPKREDYDGVQIYKESQINELLKRLKGDPLEIPILLAVFYGLRRSEVTALKWAEVDFDNETIFIKDASVPGTRQLHRKKPKNKSSRDYLSVPDMIDERLLVWKQQQEGNKLFQPNDYVNSGYVCTYSNGEELKPNFVSQHFPLLLQRIGMPHIRFHDLRHSSASYLYALGYDIKEIQLWLRHADIRTTLKYIHLGLSVKKEIADTLGERLRNLELNGTLEKI